MGAGISMAPGDIAFKCNFATIDDDSGVVISRRADRNFEHEGPILCAALDGLVLPSYPQHTVRVKYATEHRCGVAVSGPGLSDSVGDTDPLKDKLPLRRSVPTDDSPEAAFTAGLVDELSDALRERLRGHPVNQERAAKGLSVANVVLLRGCGSRIRVPSFEQRHGMRACLVAPTKIIKGLGLSFDIDSLEAPGATGYYNSALHAKAETVADGLTGRTPPPGGPQQQQGGAPPSHYGFAFMHVKAVDDTGHDRMVQMKVRMLEAVDRMVAQLLRRLWEAESGGNGRYMLVVAGDHSTPVMFGDHSHEPVPFAVCTLKQAVEALGGSDYVRSIPLGPIPMPDVTQPPSNQELCKQAEFQDARRKASWAGRPWDPAMPAEVFGPWRQPWPVAVRGDAVRCFDEVSAARGALGRFPGSQVMTLIKQLAGVRGAA